jgi:hypothetical protein
MDAQEMKDRLQGVINALIKDQPDQATQDLHDVLAAKMRARISPEEAVVEPAADATDPTDDSDSENDPVDGQE